MIDASTAHGSNGSNKRSVIFKKANDINVLNLNVKIPAKFYNFGTSESESASP